MVTSLAIRSARPTHPSSAPSGETNSRANKEKSSHSKRNRFISYPGRRKAGRPPRRKSKRTPCSLKRISCCTPPPEPPQRQGDRQTSPQQQPDAPRLRRGRNGLNCEIR